MPSPFSITTTGDTKAAQTIAATGKRANNVKPGASKIRTAYREAEQEIFQRHGGAVVWSMLKQSTREAKRRRGQDNGTLRASNALYRSLTAANASHQVDDRQPHQLRFGTTLPYADYHESGRGQAKRPTQALTASQLGRIRHAIEEFIATGDTT
jgi:hypothetical protein